MVIRHTQKERVKSNNRSRYIKCGDKEISDVNYYGFVVYLSTEKHANERNNWK